MSFSNNEVIERLKCNDREYDQVFEEDEELYRRFSKRDIDDKGEITKTAVIFPAFSVNRGKYSKPEDVLFPNYKKYGIFKFHVEDIRSINAHNINGNNYSFDVEHLPECRSNNHKLQYDNYAHSEVRTYVNGKYDENKNIAKTIKSKFRMELYYRINYIKKLT